MRAALERTFGRFIFKRRLPRSFDHASFFTSPSAGLRYLKPSNDFDPDLLRNVREVVTPGAIVYDIGANIGLFSLAAAVLAGNKGKVIAFEPDTWLVGLLRRTAALQPLNYAPIEVAPVGVASEVAIRKFIIARRSRASNALVEMVPPKWGVLPTSTSFQCSR